ncbi:MAG TPA: S41 family peptidase [Fibrobacteraceae bacterium]|nr:S41 family peptidase [Fibrobacteraceae bacterium]
MRKTFQFPFHPWFLILLVTACWGPYADAKATGDFYEEISRFNKVLSEINRKYVEDVDPAELTDAAIDGIRNILDPHTMVFSPKDYDDLKVSTDGEFGGIGITIAMRDGALTVISPLQGTPAFNLGLQAGDRIIKIEGKSTQNMELDKAVDKLRGKVGTDVTITIAREGTPEPIDFTITRARIILHAVPYAGILDGDVGYVKLAQFSQKTGPELEAAINDLKAKGMKKLVLDLRYNPGGLLNQAIEVAELFLKEGNVIVSTRGRTQKTESVASKNGILGAEYPMVVLVNEGSASASEIVAGAIQDWDRGVILGKTSFGKGSVQTIFPLDNDGHALKLTTAFYYLPMGRCINKPENGIKGLLLRREEAESDDDAEEASDDTTVTDTAAKDTQTYYTAGGRKVFGGGGITPDVSVDMKSLPWIIQVQERMNLFFKFAVKYRTVLEKSNTPVDSNWKVPDSVFVAFRDFCLKDTNFAKVKTNAQATADIVEEVLLREQKFLGDSSKTVSDTGVNASLTSLRTSLQKNRDAQFDASKAYILDAIKRELLSAYYGEEARIAFMLKSDSQALEAVKILKDQARYKKLLSPQPKTKTDSSKTDKKANKPVKK